MGANDSESSEPNPDFSILIRTRDRLAYLRRALESLERLDYPRRAYEIVVIVDGSRDGTGEWLQEWKRNANCAVTVLNSSPKGLASSNNIGLQTAKGRLVVFLDDDCLVPTDWLSLFHQAAKDKGGAVLCGRLHNGCSGNLLSELTIFLLNCLQETSRRADGQVSFSSSANTAYPCEAVALVGSFDERYDELAAEERDWNQRLQDAGWAFHDLPYLIVEHNDPLSWRRFLATHLRYGRGAFLFYQIHRHEPLFRSRRDMRLIRAILSRYKFPRNLGMSGLLVVAQLTTATGFIWQGLVSLPGRLRQ